MAAEATSPSTAASPTIPAGVKPDVFRRPSLVMKPAQTPPAAPPPPNAANGATSLTSKEWVIPPRPKPGRKPATDTPPSKRKAQNRAAQRAFRERRAARVSELEDEIKRIDDEDDKEQGALRARISQLENEVEQHRADLVDWVGRCRKLEHELSSLRASRAGSKTSAHSLVHGQPDPHDTTVGCGKCTLDTRCQCIDDAFDAMNSDIVQDEPSDKRAHSPDPRCGNKRVKTEPNEILEIDFTAMYSKPQSSSHTQHVSPISAVADPCGFCSDGTPCICAEMAAEQEKTHPVLLPQSTTSTVARSDLPHQLSEFTPPPSEGDVIPTPQCANGPGTCAQCLADPNSTAFCKSLAASRPQSQSQGAAGCCGGRTPGGSCCSTQAVPLPQRTTRSRAAAAASSSSHKPAITLTCADAYTTLSRHPGYSRATGEMTTWLPKLQASDAAMEETTGSSGLVQSRPAMEIDAANVMAVLKDFDRRFGRNG